MWGLIRKDSYLAHGIKLFIIALVSIVFMATTFARYTSAGTGSDNARVARWGIGIESKSDLNLFSEQYGSELADTQNATYAKSSEPGQKIIAPGTSQDTPLYVTFAGGKAPETQYNLECNLSVDDKVHETILKLDDNKGFLWTLQQDDREIREFNKFSELQEAFDAYSQADISPNVLPDAFSKENNTIKIGWKWLGESEAEDASDTDLGVLSRDDILKDFNITASIRAEQTQSTYHTVSFYVKGIGTTPETQTVADGKLAKDPNWDGPDEYRLLGWCTDDECTQAFSFDTPITADTKLYANWQKLDNYEVDVKLDEIKVQAEHSLDRTLSIITDRDVNLSATGTLEPEGLASVKLTPINGEHQYKVETTGNIAGKCNLKLVVNIEKAQGYARVVKYIPVTVTDEAVERDVHVALEKQEMTALETQTATVDFEGSYTSIDWSCEGADGVVSLEPSADGKTCQVIALKYCDSPIRIKATVKGPGYVDSVGSDQLVKINRAPGEIHMDDTLEIKKTYTEHLTCTPRFTGDDVNWEIVQQSPEGAISIETTPEKNKINVTGNEMGTAKIRAYVEQTDVYEAAEAFCDVTVTKSTTTVDIAWGDTKWIYDGESHQLICSFTNIGEDDVRPILEGENSVKHVSDGHKTITLTGLDGADKDKYDLPAGDLSKEIYIEPFEAGLTWDSNTFVYTGLPQGPKATVNNLKKAADVCNVTVSGQQTDVGNGYTARAESIDNQDYCLSDQESSRTTTFDITKVFVDEPTAVSGLTYNGSPQRGVTPYESQYYSVDDGEETDAGSYEATVSLNKPENYQWKNKGDSENLTIPFKINPKSLSGFSVVLGSFPVYNGAEQSIGFSVKDDDATLTRDTDYYVVDNSDKATNVSSSNITLKIEGKGNYSGTNETKTWNIQPKSIASTDIEITLSDSSFEYDTGSHLPDIDKVFDKSREQELVSGSDYSYACEAQTNVGNYKISFTGLNNYTSNNEASWEIYAAEIDVDINGNASSYPYSGETQTVSGFQATSSWSHFITANVVSSQTPLSVSGSEIGSYTLTIDSDKLSYTDTNVVPTFNIKSPISLTITDLQLQLIVTPDPTSAYIGNDVTYRVQLKNNGSTDLENINVTDTLFGYNHTYNVDSGQTISCDGLTHTVTGTDFSSSKIADTFNAKVGTVTINSPTEVSLIKTAVAVPSIADSVYNASVRYISSTDSISYSGATEGKNAGKYTTYANPKPGCCWEGGTSDQVTIIWNIIKASLSVTAKNNTITYGDAPSGAGVTYSGFVGGETASVLTGTLGYDFNYSQYGDVDKGPYYITPKGLSSGNYNITYNRGTLTVNKATRTASLSAASNIAYIAVDGKAVTSSVTATTDKNESNSTSNTYTFTTTVSSDLATLSSSGATATVNPKLGGTVPVYVTVSSNNYENCSAGPVNVSIDNFTYSTSGSGVKILQYKPYTASSSATLTNSITIPSSGTKNVIEAGDGTYNIFNSSKTASSVTLNSNLATINKSAFSNSDITSINFSNASNLTTIGVSAFEGSKITGVDFSKCTKLKTISENAFNGLSTIQGPLSFPASVLTIDSNAFAGTTQAGDITFATDAKIQTVRVNSFAGSKYMTDNESNGSSIADTNNKVILGHAKNWSRKTQNLDPSFCCIADSAYLKTSSDTNDPGQYLRKVTIANKNMHIGANAFKNCATLETFLVTASEDNITYGLNVFSNAGHVASTDVATASNGAQTIFAGVTKGSNSHTEQMAANLQAERGFTVDYYTAVAVSGGNYSGKLNLANNTYNYLTGSITFTGLNYDSYVECGTSSAKSIKSVLDLRGQTIDRNLTSKSELDNGYCVFVHYKSTLRLDDTTYYTDRWDGDYFTHQGKITGGNNTNNGGGGGIRVGSHVSDTASSYSEYGVLNMACGLIYNNTATWGGGVSVSRKCTFNMYNGCIAGNHANGTKAIDGGGGGVGVIGNDTYTASDQPKFNMYGGRISGNDSTYYGGALYLYSRTYAHMYGGLIGAGSVDSKYDYDQNYTIKNHGAAVTVNSAGDDNYTAKFIFHAGTIGRNYYGGKSSTLGCCYKPKAQDTCTREGSASVAKLVPSNNSFIETS